MLIKSDTLVEAVAVGVVFTCCMCLVGLGYLAGRQDAVQLPICERTLLIKDGSGVSHEYILECK